MAQKCSFLELAKSRKTTYEYDAKAVPANALKNILEAGRWAPSCTNSQPWHFIIVKNKERIAKLMKTANYGNFHMDPPLMICLVLVKKACAGKEFSCFRDAISASFDTQMSVGMAALNMIYEA